VVVVADDPGLHSSQNEQDSRYYARLAKVPLLEPSDAQEAKDMVSLAFEMSERYDTPVLLRSTTRLSHTSSPVVLKEREEKPLRDYVKDPAKYVMVPANARLRHQVLEERLKKLTQASENSPLNSIEWGSEDVGVISSGVAYLYAKEVFNGASFLKLAFSYPLPVKLIKKFCSRVKQVYVVEEVDPVVEVEVKALGFKVLGKDLLPRAGELNPDLIKQGFLDKTEAAGLSYEGDLPARPPVLCPGCPHRGVFYILKKLGATVLGDIGCYTLGVLPPLESMDTCLCMGGGLGQLQGFKQVLPEKPAVAVIGDSTFLHAGLPSLLNLVYNRGAGTVIILDNRTTAMTGRQDHPGTGRTLKGEETKAASYLEIAKALGVEEVAQVDPYNLKQTEKVLKEAIERKEPSVVVSKRPCVLVERGKGKAFYIDEERCSFCEACFELGCPAIQREDEAPFIDPLLCLGCTLCPQVCPERAVRSKS
jgi:indolepyruvate ferredoxin oxidoreductase alpha subunit